MLHASPYIFLYSPYHLNLSNVLLHQISRLVVMSTIFVLFLFTIFPVLIKLLLYLLLFDFQFNLCVCARRTPSMRPAASAPLTAPKNITLPLHLARPVLIAVTLTLNVNLPPTFFFTPPARQPPMLNKPLTQLPSTSFTRRLASIFHHPTLFFNLTPLFALSPSVTSYLFLPLSHPPSPSCISSRTPPFSCH